MTEEYRYKKEDYLKFPISYFQQIWQESKRQRVFNNIVEYGFFDYAMKRCKKDVCEKILIDFLNQRKVYLSETFPFLQEFVSEFKLSKQESNENLEEASNGLKDLIEEEYIFKDRVEQAKELLGIYEINFDEAYETWKNSKDEKLTPTLSKEMVLEFTVKPKKEFDLAQLTAFIACKSIIGNRNFGGAYQEQIVSRMLGFGSKEEFNKAKLNEYQLEIWNKYLTRYWREKLLKRLGGNWKIYNHGRNGEKGFYIANGNKISLEQFLKAVENYETDNATKYEKKKKEILKGIRNNKKSENSKDQNSENSGNEEDDYDLP